MLNGYRVIANPLVPEFTPRMQLSTECRAVLTPEFATSVNEWMRSFFGEVRHVLMAPPGAFGPGAVVVAHPNTIAVLSLAAPKLGEQEGKPEA